MGSLKPGAVSLLSGRDTVGRGEQPVLAFQRYGRGRVIALPVQDTWHWQMAAQIAVDDREESAERSGASCSAGSPTRSCRPGRSRSAGADLAPGEPVTLDVELRDETWQPVNDSTVTAR